MDLTATFYNRNDRLRSGWRFAVFLAAFIFATLALGVFLLSAFALFRIDTSPGSPLSVIADSGAGLIPALVIGWLCGRYFEGLPFRALGAWFTDGWMRHLLAGAAGGALAVGLAALIAVIAGGLRFELNAAEPSAIVTTLLVSLAVFAVAAAFEEALFRGYILQTFARAGFAWPAIVMTSLFFAAVHVANPEASRLSAVNTGLAGIWFGVAYLKTRDLWFVFGLHWLWNWVQGSVFGIEVSGLTDIMRAPLLLEVDGGPVWLTGGDYGLEGGVACTAALLAAIGAVYLLPLRADEELAAMTSRETPANVA